MAGTSDGSINAVTNGQEGVVMFATPKNSQNGSAIQEAENPVAGA